MFTLLSLLVLSFLPLVADLGAFLDALVASPQSWGTLLGIGTPLLVSVLKQPWITPRWHRPLAFLVAGLVGLATVLAADQFNPTDLISTIALVLIASQTAYSTYWKPSLIATTVEFATNLPVSREAEPADYYEPRVDPLDRA